MKPTADKISASQPLASYEATGARHIGANRRDRGVKHRLAKMLRLFADMISPAPTFTGSNEAALVEIDRDGLIVSASLATETLLRTFSNGMGFAMAFLPEERARICRALGDNEMTTISARARRADGSVVKVRMFLDRGPNQDGHISVLLVDETDLDLMARRLSQETAKARAESQSSAALLADLSHEMKTPLNAVIGFSETMAQETFGPMGHPKYGEYAEHIRASGRHLLDLVSSILDLARIDANRMSLTPVLTDPAAIARECVGMVEIAAEQAGLRLVTSIDDELPECFLDPRAVRQILLNLLSNAVKFTSDGEVRLSLKSQDGALQFEVQDTGVGMNEADLESLGARFTEIHALGVRGANGAGLGLSLAFALANLHGGNLRLTSAPGEGLTAHVTLPIELTDSKAIAPRQALPNAPFEAASAMPHPTSTTLRSPIEASATQTADSAVEAGRSDHSTSHNHVSSPDKATSNVLTQLERIEAYRRELSGRRHETRSPGRASAA
ncbi:MAG: HAMP domain-containing sensor histidine kinase [Pseudomonadota bacterium]